MSAIKQEDRLIRYLLGDLPAQDREQVEARYLEDEDFFTELQVTEDEIIDAYVNGRLTARNRALFEKNFLNSDRRRERVHSARALMTFARRHRAAPARDQVSPWQRAREFFRVDYPLRQWALVSGLLVALVGGGWLWFEVVRLRSQLADAQAAQSRRMEEVNQRLMDLARVNQELKEASSAEREKLEQEREQLRQDVERLEQQVSTNTLVSAVLEVEPGGITRGAPQKQITISIPAAAKRVRLQLDLKSDDYTRYETVLLNDLGQEVRRDSITSTKTAKGRSIILRIPAQDLPAGGYRLLVDGVTEQNETRGVGEFLIRVVRK